MAPHRDNEFEGAVSSPNELYALAFSQTAYHACPFAIIPQLLPYYRLKMIFCDSILNRTACVASPSALMTSQVSVLN